MKTLCTNCWGGLVAHAREKLLRSQGKPVTCMECGDELAKQRKFTVACNNKQGYELITDLSHLKQLNPKRTI